MKYGYSHEPAGPFIGEFDTPAMALTIGWGKLGNADKIFVAQLEPASYSHFWPQVRVLVSMMREEVSDRIGDENADVYDLLTAGDLEKLSSYVNNAVEEWESELPRQKQFTGSIVRKVVGYDRDDAVRVTDFK